MRLSSYGSLESTRELLEAIAESNSSMTERKRHEKKNVATCPAQFTLAKLDKLNEKFTLVKLFKPLDLEKTNEQTFLKLALKYSICFMFP